MRSRVALWVRSASRSAANRVTIAAVVLWLLYIVAERPWSYHSRREIYEIPAMFFVKIGANVARAMGLNAWDLGAVQFVSGLAALVLTVRLGFWVFRPKGEK